MRIISKLTAVAVLFALAAISGPSWGQGLPIKSGVDSTIQTIDPTSKAARVTLYNADGSIAAGLSDLNGTDALVTPPGRVRVGIDDVVFWDPVDGTALNTNIWQTSLTTMTVTQTVASGILLNAGASTATSVNAILNSIKIPPRIGDYGMAVRFYAKPINLPEANAVGELGFGTVATTSAPTDGSFFRWSGAAFQAVVNFNGTESTTTLATPSAAYHNFEIWRVTSAQSIFFVDGALVATLTPGANPAQSTTTRLPVFLRVYDTGSSPALAAQISIASVLCNQLDVNWSKFYSDEQAGRGLGAYQSPVTAFGQTANHTNSTSPSSATLSNTAAGYTTLGGRWQFAAVVGAVTDFALFGYQVPTGYQLVVKQVAITACNTGAAAGASGTILDWSVGVNSSAVSLATADGTNTWAPRRIPIGTQGIASAAAIGACSAPIVQTFDPPLVVDSGRFFHIIMQEPIGLATASEVYRGDVLVDGYFE